METVTAAGIAQFCKTELIGDDLEITGVATLDDPKPGHLLFANKHSDETAAALNATTGTFVIAHADYAGQLQGSHILSDNPRLAVARVLAEFFEKKPAPGIADTARISPNAKIGEGVTIGEYVVIEEDCIIGDHVQIGHHCVIGRNTHIGDHSVLKAHVVTGQRGFGFETDENGLPVPIPHLGGVRIGKHVEVGSFNTVLRGTIGDTRIEDHAKLDDHIHVAHNVQIGRAAIVTASVMFAGSAKIGADAWIAPSAALMNGVTVGERALVGLGAVVTRDVPENTIVAGNPAKPLRKRFAE